ncbi:MULTISPECIES: hypothetical protein [Halorussus]|uniref:hypothetical protein n=1 Tax=Halorussus TaxID=1070314 RepID=UPI000E2138B5|nr:MULTISPECIES: hypothetical protein [Halorussus]NHN59667.1 hypothetical protein [Halorussus sp. JP-T4]
MTVPLSRRSVLRTGALGSLGLFAGCVSSGGDGQPSTTTFDGYDCDGVQSPPSPAGTDEIDPEPYPDFPAELSRSTATEFVTAYERAYKHNEILARERNLTYVHVGNVGVSGAEETDEGFVVRVVVEFGWGEGGGGSDGTTTVLHADDGSKVSYLVGEDVLKRVDPDEWEFADPRTAAGALLRCWAGTTTA